MKKITKKTIKKYLNLIAAVGLISCSIFGNASETISKQTPPTKETTNASVTKTLLFFQPFSENKQDEELVKILEETQTFNRIQKIIETNFVLTTPIRFHIQQVKESTFVETRLEQKSYIITIPFSFLYTLYQGLSNKFEHQIEAINIIFSASVEFYIWSEFAEYLIKNKKLEVAGDTFAAMDNFASIMMLNQNNPSSDYIADASEAYLLIRQTKLPSVNKLAKNELQLDQQRYRHIICLSIGFDQINQSPEIEKYHLKSFSWDEAEIEQCKNSYLDIMSNWYQAISPFLSKANLITHWLKQK